MMMKGTKKPHSQLYISLILKIQRNKAIWLYIYFSMKFTLKKQQKNKKNKKKKVKGKISQPKN
jgi:hypothetical protein